MTCETCLSLDSKIYNNLSEDIDLGTIDELRKKSRTCSSCLGIAKRAAPPSGGSLAAQVVLSRQSNTGEPLLLASEQNRSIRGLGYFLRKDDKEDRAELLDRKWIDLSRIQQWLAFCDTLHEGHCHHFPPDNTIESLEKLRLLDVEKGCLVTCPGNVKYFALSYVWGRSADAVEARKENLEALKQAGTLSPDTDANYHILNMDSVYANSYCTIVAADGKHADHGLPGVGAGSAPRWCLQSVIRFPQSTLVSKTEEFSQGTPHGRRGWTFQEIYLARRCLLFSRDSVFWKCQRSSWREDTRSNPEDTNTEENQRDKWSLRFDAWPNLRHWTDLVDAYNYRDLTYPEDAQSAFTGIENVLQRSVPGGFLYGLPEFFFDYALLWQPRFSMERRARENGCALPSWSWLGWKGRVDMDFCIPDDFVRQRPPWGTLCKLEPVAEWTHLGPLPDLHRIIRNDYSVWRAKAGTSTVPTDKWIESKDGQKTFYTTSQVPALEFAYPWPSVAEMPPVQELRTWPARLRLRSTRAFFMISEVIPNLGKNPDLATTVKLADKSQGKWAGLLHLNIRLGDAHIAPVGQECELIALSSGRVLSWEDGRDYRFEELNWPETGRDKCRYAFYNVLCVRWEGGHVLREALGRVEMAVWHEQALEEVDVELW
ncbi:uncharacterized protein K452DRAFT_334664 [Aplosporella prunicola CBS 121167]|uniref:Heterokaryon incompatibility domain-containing protein n=1 Tax=Aplosporella prunicola CBS 121167 TaxID=1176127 RepID=A0A6A6BAL8_9PEZI|nr:uncharacterized protein K452DRAFT_334664 [Aplosporella prunicola CBS 121167]KAF2141140.1 hypothetical protein K452DRAFT_334664 [Aplosporella prunicola CBS 121167]